MNISSTPFIRNDYWPDYNDINQLNQRIDDVENEISLVNVRLSTDIENVSNNLNTYAKEQADTSISNNIIVNNLNANYAEGRFANFDNTFTNNAYVENLTVNKPVFDITLNTPHLENTTSLGGNFYNANLFDANVSNLYVDISSAPVQSSAVLGYDSEGKVIPVHATYAGFPENADYLCTDGAGITFGGVRATEIGEVENLITAYGVKNAIDALNTEVVDNFNLVNDNLNTIYQRQNSFENNFNNVANSLNDMNVATETLQTSVNENFNTLSNHLNEVESNLKTISDFMLDDIYIPEYGSFNSTSPVDYTGATEVELYGNAQGGTAVPDGGGVIKYDATTKKVTFGFSGACKGIGNANMMFAYCGLLNQYVRMPNSVVSMENTFRNCYNLNQNILIPNSVVSMENTFCSCYNLNQSILIPNGVVNVQYTFSNCYNLNRNILISNSVVGMPYTFSNCTSLNQNILIPNSVVSMESTFGYCNSLNQNIQIPNSVTDMSYTFYSCESLNQNILIPNSVVTMGDTFGYCSNLNQNIQIPNSVVDMLYTFQSCPNLNQNILIPNSVVSMEGTFVYCSNLNQNILIPNSVTSTHSTFYSCTNLNRDIYIYSQGLVDMRDMFLGTKVNLHNVHVPISVPKDTSNFIYNSLVNGATGVTFAPENIINDLPVDPVVWPPVD